MKVNFSVLDRIMMLQALPAEENIITLRIVRDLKKSLSFTEDELKVLNIRPRPEGGLIWDAPMEREFDIGEKAAEVMASALKALNDKKKLTEQHVDLWDKVVKDRV